MSSMTRVVDPLFVDVMEFVVDRYRGPVIADDLGVHLRIVLILPLARVENILTGIRFNVTQFQSR
jgi:hypothetical protein